jgi:hypothetical protein
MKNHIFRFSLIIFMLIGKLNNIYAQCTAGEKISYGTFDAVSNGTNYAAYSIADATTQAAPPAADINPPNFGWQDPSTPLSGGGAGSGFDGFYTIANTDDSYWDWNTANNIHAAPSGSGNFMMLNTDGSGTGAMPAVGAAVGSGFQLLSNAITTVVGCSYNFSIDYAEINAYGSTTRGVALAINGIIVSEADLSNVCINCTDNNNPGWRSLSYSFTGAATSTTVQLYVYTSGSNKNDFAFDNFSLKIPSTSPVTFLFFDSKSSDDGVLLTWITGSEKNSNYFEVQKSIDGNNWSAIGIVASKNNASGAMYQFNDQESTQDIISYYRIREVDFDNASMLSKTISIAGSDKNNSFLEVIPSIADHESQIRIDFSHDITSLMIYDQMGRIFLSKNLNSPGNSLPFDCSGLSSGLYIIKGISEEGKIVVRKFLVK